MCIAIITVQANECLFNDPYICIGIGKYKNETYLYAENTTKDKNIIIKHVQVQLNGITKDLKDLETFNNIKLKLIIVKNLPEGKIPTYGSTIAEYEVTGEVKYLDSRQKENKIEKNVGDFGNTHIGRNR